MHLTKRSFDLIVTALAIILLSPLYLIITAAVLLDVGAPVLFRQRRPGYKGRPFHIHKFRTMRDAQGSAPQGDEARLTRFGRWLRSTSLDELPELFNILRGEMSLVGPRPTSFGPETYKLWHTERLDVLPGITGLWQILGRASLEFDDRLRLDIIYIERRCIMLDMLILIKTVTAVFQQRGAH